MKGKRVAEVLSKVIAGLPQDSKDTKALYVRAKASFERRAIGSYSRLIENYWSLTRQEKFVALSLLGELPYKPSLAILFKEVFSRHADISGRAAGAIATIGGSRVLRRLIELLSGQTDKRARLNLVSALALLSDVRSFQSQSLWIDSLMEIVRNPYELEGCRASAAEGLANALYSYDRRRKKYREAINILIAILDDSSPEVRFCSAFALGELRVRRALPKLNDVAIHDHAKCSGHAGHPGGWTVSDEASLAIRALMAKT